MKTKRTFLLIILAILLSIIISPLHASDDKENPNIDDWDTESVYPIFICDTDHKARLVGMPTYDATNVASLIPAHCRTEDGRNKDPIPLMHSHWLYTLNSTECALVDEFWDYRFWEGVKTARIESASTDHQTCFEYAFTESYHSAGIYDFRIISGDLIYVFANDFSEVDPTVIECDDILSYNTFSHATLVSAISSGNPFQTKWCWGASGVYWMQAASVGVDPYDTPMCEGAMLDGQYIWNQNWTWDPDYCTGPTIYSD